MIGAVTGFAISFTVMEVIFWLARRRGPASYTYWCRWQTGAWGLQVTVDVAVRASHDQLLINEALFVVALLHLLNDWWRRNKKRLLAKLHGYKHRARLALLALAPNPRTA